MNKPLLGLCAGVAMLLFFLVLALFALVRKEIAVGLLYAGIGCIAFMAAVLYLIAATCHRRERREKIIPCRNCGSGFIQLTPNIEVCPDCVSGSPK